MGDAMTTMPLGRSVGRRRVISILAASAALPLLGHSSRATTTMEPFRWQGIVLGAASDLTLYAPDRAQAAQAIEMSLAEIARLESIFSLHQADSALSQLNGTGRLDRPPFELVELLSRALALSASSAGRFDPTVQPLWKLIADHFAAPNADPAGPAPATLAAARALVDHSAVEVDPDAIVFRQPGMQVTLNGIAQGYISDQIGELLQTLGFRHTLVNLGETLAIDRRPDGTAWRIGVPDPADHARLVTEIDLPTGAVATSAGRGLLFEPSGRFNHIVDPERLVCSDLDRSVTVLASSAAVADGLSTLGALLPDPERDYASFLRQFGARAYLVTRSAPSGTWLT